MQTIAEIKTLANTRVDEAEVLYTSGFYDGAIYMAGYAVELALKAKICQLLDIPDLFNGFNGGQVQGGTVKSEYIRNFKTHDLEHLIILSGLRNKLQIAKRNNPDLFTNWSLIGEWSENKRYCICGTCQQADARKFLDAISDSTNGIKTWIENN